MNTFSLKFVMHTSQVHAFVVQASSLRSAVNSLFIKHKLGNPKFIIVEYIDPIAEYEDNLIDYSEGEIDSCKVIRATHDCNSYIEVGNITIAKNSLLDYEVPIKKPQVLHTVPLEPTDEMYSGLARLLGRYMQTYDRYSPKSLYEYLDRYTEIPEWLNEEVGNWESDHAFATADLPVFIYKAMLKASIES